MTLGDIVAKARTLSHTDTVSYPDAAALIDANIWYQKIPTIIFESQDDSDYDDTRLGSGGSSGTATYPIVTQAFVAGQRDYQIPFSKGILKVKRVDVTYDGTNYYRATPFDAGSFPYGLGNPTLEDQNFIAQAPRYDWQYNSFFMYPLATTAQVAAGAQFVVRWERNVIPFTTADYTSVLTDSTQVPGFDVNFHPMMSYGMAYEVANANNLPQLQNIKQDLVDWEVRLRTAYGRKDLDTVLSLMPAYDSYGDYGGYGGGWIYR